MTESNTEVVLVTGSSGLIGFPLIERVDEDYQVVGFDREGHPFPPETAVCIDMDLGSDESVLSGLQQARERFGNRVASVVHLAAYYDFKGEPSPLYEKITVRGTERLLRGLQSFQVEQFIFSSTMLVHPSCEPGEQIDESQPLKATWDYPESKIRTEELIREQHGDIPFVLLRIAGVYDDDCHSIPIAHQIQRIFERSITSKLFPGDVHRGQSFVHLNDLIDVFIRLIQRRAGLPPELALLIGEPETYSYDELQRTFGRLIHGEEWETTEIPKAIAKTGAWLQDHTPFMEEPFIKPWMIDLADDHYALDISRARELLGWEPRRSLRGTLPRMIERLRENPPAWYRENKLNPPSHLEHTAAATAEG